MSTPLRLTIREYDAMIALGAFDKVKEGRRIELIRKELLDNGEVLKLKVRDFDLMLNTGAFEVLAGRRVELIHGELRESGPASQMHGEVLERLTGWTDQYRAVDGQILVELRNLDSVTQPDIAWVQPGDSERRRAGPGDIGLLIEVADGSLAYDLGEKQQLYATAGVPEYWVVDVQSRQIHVFQKPLPTGYKEAVIVGEGETVAPVAAPNAELDVRRVFVR